jgi:pSer/pThr/pTyr-binding forkhead associated (FHA) protein
MAKLLVFHNGQHLTELKLEPGQEYFVGRGENCHIRMHEGRGVSRQHLKIFWQNNSWQVSLQSKYGGLLHNGASVNGLSLTQDDRFSLFNYEFSFVSESSEQSQPLDNAVAVKPDQPEVSQIEELSATGGMESTKDGINTLFPHLTITNKKTKSEELLKLNGDAWTAGRSADCEIVIKDASMSRKHFEIRQTASGFTITDLGSSNGTFVNGEKLLANQPQALKSRDEIAVRHIKILFEIRDIAFEQKLKDLGNLPALYENPLELESGDPEIEDFDRGTIGVKRMRTTSNEPQGLTDNPLFKKALVAGVVLIALYWLFGGESQQKQDLTSKPPTDGVSKISEADMSSAKSHYDLAYSHHQNSKYELCIDQLSKLEKIVPVYPNAQELKDQCQNALELELTLRDEARRVREKEETENKIRVNVENCRSTMKPTTTTSDLRKCLETALELSPEHPAVNELLQQVQLREDEAKSRQQAIAANREKQAQGRAAFKRAQSLEDKQELKSAIQAYKNFLASNYDLPSEEALAKKAIKKIEATIEARLNKATQDCQALMDEGKFREAYAACGVVMNENPNYSPAKEIRTRAMASIRKSMKVLWEEAVLAESYGNIEAAKEKWNKIISDSIPEDEYYQKSQVKVKKHLGGI